MSDFYLGRSIFYDGGVKKRNLIFNILDYVQIITLESWFT